MVAKEVNASTAQECAAKYLGCTHDTNNVLVSEFIREAVAEKIDREREVHITVGPAASNLPVPSWMAPHGEII